VISPASTTLKYSSSAFLSSRNSRTIRDVMESRGVPKICQISSQAILNTLAVSILQSPDRETDITQNYLQKIRSVNEMRDTILLLRCKCAALKTNGIGN
jgi:hypothetical protein